MNIKRLIEKITIDWPAKVICLCLAIFIYTFHQVSTLGQKTITIPLHVISDGALMSKDNFPGFVKVYVKANPEQIVSVTSKDIKATLNLNSYAESGTYEVPVSFDLCSELQGMEPLEISISPETVKLTLEKKDIKYVNVVAATSGEPDNGYYVSNIEVVPSSIKVEGPESILAVTDKINTKKVMVKGAKTTFSTTTEVDNINSLLKVYPEQDYRVNVEIQAIQSAKKFDKIVPVVNGLREGFKITSPVPGVSVELSGPVNGLSKYSINKASVFVNCKDLNYDGELPITITLPVQTRFSDPYSCKSVSPDKITVTIEKEIIPELEETPLSEDSSLSSDSELNNDSQTDEALENSKDIS